MSSPPLFSTSADPELPSPSIQLPLAQVASTILPGPIASSRTPPPILPASPNERIDSPTPVPLPEPDSDSDDGAAPPITLSASVVLTSIPRDSRIALANAFMPSTDKILVRMLSVGATPSLRKNVVTLTASRKFSVVVTFLRKKLRLDAPAPATSPTSSGNLAPLPNNNGQSLFVYVNSTFAPSLDEEVGNLFRCFKREDELIVNYCLTPAFG
ncbi:hypothetical protein H072_6465 [Dactylellina haptotyla CBS 200.50]|uniref:Ubiquitin-like protein ATG12 n=1 Tax=Dactylellina haptotyla (strain CBS 200.50) TaxID=1284197 RepID=S8AF11_DACHA|nr:hypothetical protein H072_6465 [Dactylellina haptotyla CBS 200.50]